jgi:hypothetical protein
MDDSHVAMVSEALTMRAQKHLKGVAIDGRNNEKNTAAG